MVVVVVVAVTVTRTGKEPKTSKKRNRDRHRDCRKTQVWNWVIGLASPYGLLYHHSLASFLRFLLLICRYRLVVNGNGLARGII